MINEIRGSAWHLMQQVKIMLLFFVNLIHLTYDHRMNENGYKSGYKNGNKKYDKNIKPTKKYIYNLCPFVCWIVWIVE